MLTTIPPDITMSDNDEGCPEVKEIQMKGAEVKVEVDSGPKIQSRAISSSTSLNNPQIFRKTGMPRGAMTKYLTAKPSKPESVVTIIDVEDDQRCESPDEVQVLYDSFSSVNSAPASGLNPPIKMAGTPERASSPEIEVIGYHYHTPVEPVTAAPSNPSTIGPSILSIRDLKCPTLPLPTETSSDINGNQLLVEPLIPTIHHISPSNVGSGFAILTPRPTNRPVLGERLVIKSVISLSSDSHSDELILSEETVRSKEKSVHMPPERKRTATPEEKENGGLAPESFIEHNKISKENNIPATQGTTLDDVDTPAVVLPECKIDSTQKQSSLAEVDDNILANNAVTGTQSCNGIIPQLEAAQKTNILSASVGVQYQKTKESNDLPSSGSHERKRKSSNNLTINTAKEGPNNNNYKNRKIYKNGYKVTDGKAMKRCSNLELETINDAHISSKHKKYKKGLDYSTPSNSTHPEVAIPTTATPSLSVSNTKRLSVESSEAQSPKSKPPKVRRISTASSSNGSSTSKSVHSTHRHQKFPEQMSQTQKSEIIPLMRKKRYGDVLKRLAEMFHETYPPEDIVAEIIGSCILRTHGRTSKEVYVLAVDYFQKLVETLACHSWSHTYFMNIFDGVSEIRRRSTSAVRLVDHILSFLKDESKLRFDEKYALKFFKSFTLVLEKDYEQYESKTVKVRQPLIVEVMLEGVESSLNENNSVWYSFLNSLLRLPSPEVAAGLVWINLIAKHYNRYESNQFWKDSKKGFESKQLIQDFQNVAGGLKDCGLKFIKLIKDEALALEISRGLICSRLPNAVPIDDWTNILRELSAHFSCAAARPTKDEVPVSTSQVDTPFGMFVSGEKNLSGESLLHIACQGKRSTFSFQGHEYTIRHILRHMKKSRCGDINVRDNAGNTPLHDACYHGNRDVICNILELFTDANEPSGPFKVDLLAKDNEGFTALHNAVSKKKDSCIRFILNSANILDCKDELIRARTDTGLTVWDFLTTWDPVVDGKTLEEVQDLLGAPPIVRCFFGGVKFPVETILAVEKNISLQALIMYWRDLHDALHSPKRALSDVPPD